MFIRTLFVVTKYQKPQYPSKDKWLSRLWYIHTMEYYSAIKKNELHVDTCDNLESPQGYCAGKKKSQLQKLYSGTSLVVQWLRLHAPNARGPSLSPGQGTRSHTPCGVAKKKKKKVVFCMIAFIYILKITKLQQWRADQQFLQGRHADRGCKSKEVA